MERYDTNYYKDKQIRNINKEHKYIVDWHLEVIPSDMTDDLWDRVTWVAVKENITEEELIDRIIFNSSYSEKLEFIRREISDDLYLWNILEVLRWWTDDWRFESWIVTKVCMNRAWKLSDEIECDTYDSIKKREKTINYLQVLLSEKYRTKCPTL